MHALLRVKLSEGDPKSWRHDITLDPGRSRAGKVVRPAGRPLAGAHVAGLFEGNTVRTLTGDAFTITGLRPDRTRVLVFLHPEKKLGKVQTARGDTDEAFTVRLEPTGDTVQRLQAEGRPLAGHHIAVFLDLSGKGHENLPSEFGLGRLTFGFTFRPGAWQDFTSRRATTDRGGRFRLDGLLPGQSYTLAASAEEIKQGYGCPTRGRV